MPVAFHLDENIPPALADALRNRGIDVTTTANAGLTGTPDREHLSFASTLRRIYHYSRRGFLTAARPGEYLMPVSHSGVNSHESVGEVLRRLLLIHAAMSPENMQNRVEYL